MPWGHAVGSFVAIVPCPGATTEADDLFLRACRAIRDEPDSIISNAWSFAALWHRLNGSGSPIIHDARAGSWLAALGTPFHRSGDNRPEYLLEQFLTVGAQKLANDLDGFFVIVAGNDASREIVVITDIIGSLHCYHRQLSLGIALCTSSLALAQLDPVTLDVVGCQEFLGTGVIYEDRTLYNEVRKLPPATITTFRDGHRITQEQYWDVARLAPESFPTATATDALWENLTTAIARINRQFDSVVCDLTGGYDSRAIAAAFLAGQKKFATVVSGAPGSGDVVISLGLAKVLGLEHVHYPPSTDAITSAELEATLLLTDGEYDLLEYVPVARIHRDLSRRFQISINGSFGEVARGYWWELLLPHVGARSKLDSHKVAARRYALSSASSLFQPQYRIDLIQHIQDVVDRSVAGFAAHPNTFQMDVAYLRMRMQRWQGRIASSTNRIWPCLSPFMFRAVLETMLQAQFAVRRRSLLVRLMLEKYQPRLAAYPLEHGNPALPVTWQTFPRFWPLVPYYVGKVGQRMEHKILRKPRAETRSPRQQLWKLDEVRALLAPASMKSLTILDSGAVAAFLDNSQKPGFPQNAEWGRLLTLEWALSKADVRSPE